MAYTPPDSQNLELNFDQPLIDIDPQNIILNFGASTEIDHLKAEIATAFTAKMIGSVESPADFRGNLSTVINTNFIAVFTGSSIKPIDHAGHLNAVINTGFLSGMTGVFDINHILGPIAFCGIEYQKALTQLYSPAILWAKPILRVSNEALFFDKGLLISHQALAGFDRGLTLSESVRFVHEQGTGLSSNITMLWQENIKIRIANSLLFDEGLKLKINRLVVWQEMIRRRKQITFSHEVAEVFEKKFSFEWDKGLEIVTTDSIPWDKSKAIHYQKHPVQPWPKPPIPQYFGSTDLNFICLCNDVDTHNIILNFGADDCLPAIPNRNWWYILNSLSVTRLDNGEEIVVYDGNYGTDRSRWCWSYSLTVPYTEIPKLKPINGQPVILKIIVNGNEHHMLLENRSRSHKFGKITYTLTGRSQTALLSAPTSPLRSFLQENERTSVQLCQAELDRVFSDTVLNWQLIDELGWVVENQSLSYNNLAPIDAIKMVAESGGGFVYSEKGSNTLSIKPLYKKTFWDSMTIQDYDRLIPESIVTDLSTDDELYPDYNGITLTNDRNGKQGQVRRIGTSADTLLPPENNPLFNHVSMGAYGKAKLAKAGLVETHSFLMPVSNEVGECAPGEVIAFNAEWWGIVDSINVSFTHALVNQTVKVERVNRE